MLILLLKAPEFGTLLPGLKLVLVLGLLVELFGLVFILSLLEHRFQASGLFVYLRMDGSYQKLSGGLFLPCFILKRCQFIFQGFYSFIKL